MTRTDVNFKSVEVVNLTLSNLAQLGCIAVWRSVGSNVFFEFGMPIIKRIRPKTRNSFTVVRGEAAIGIHADNWYMRIREDLILTSSMIDDAILSKVAREFFLGIPMPKFDIDRDGFLEIVFDRSIAFRIERNAYPQDAGDSCDEVSINLLHAGFRFNFRQGFYIVPDEEYGDGECGDS